MGNTQKIYFFQLSVSFVINCMFEPMVLIIWLITVNAMVYGPNIINCMSKKIPKIALLDIFGHRASLYSQTIAIWVSKLPYLDK